MKSGDQGNMGIYDTDYLWTWQEVKLETVRLQDYKFFNGTLGSDEHNKLLDNLFYLRTFSLLCVSCDGVNLLYEHYNTEIFMFWNFQNASWNVTSWLVTCISNKNGTISEETNYVIKVYFSSHGLLRFDKLFQSPTLFSFFFSHLPLCAGMLVPKSWWFNGTRQTEIKKHDSHGLHLGCKNMQPHASV